MEEMAKLQGDASEQIKHEQSRTVKICLVKYKCILLVIFLILALLQMLYILVTKLMADDDFTTKLFSYLNRTRSDD